LIYHGEWFDYKEIKGGFSGHGKIVGSGSGTIISPDGFVITANHVVRRGERIKVAIGSKVYSAKVVKRITDLDVLLLKIQSARTDFPFSELMDCKKYPMGLPVFTVSYPNPEIQGYYPKLSKSYIAADRGTRGNITQIQICCDAGSGSSGSAIFSTGGKVIGVLTTMLDPKIDVDDYSEDIAFATKSGSFFKYLEDHLPLPTVEEETESIRIIEVATKSSVLLLSCEK